MTELEKTINRIMSERRRAEEKREIAQNLEAGRKRAEQLYAKEFDAIYQAIGSMENIRDEFIVWADECRISDGNDMIKDGQGFYEHLLSQAQRQYVSSRQQGLGQAPSFDRSTEGIAMWIQESQDKRPGGTIYVNHTRDYMRRIRKMEW